MCKTSNEGFVIDNKVKINMIEKSNIHINPNDSGSDIFIEENIKEFECILEYVKSRALCSVRFIPREIPLKITKEQAENLLEIDPEIEQFIYFPSSDAECHMFYLTVPELS